MDVVVLGAGGHAREVADTVTACADAGQPVRLLGFLDDNEAMHGRELCGFPVLGGIDWLQGRKGDHLRVVSGIGSPVARRKAIATAQAFGAEFETIVHPAAVLTKFIEMGPGVVVTAGCVLTNQIQIGDHAHINRCATVGHDCRVGAFCHLAPRSVLSGNVVVGEGADVGTGAVVIQGVTVGSWAIVGAGAAVIRNVPEHATVVGVPARVIGQREGGSP